MQRRRVCARHFTHTDTHTEGLCQRKRYNIEQKVKGIYVLGVQKVWGSNPHGPTISDMPRRSLPAKAGPASGVTLFAGLSFSRSLSSRLRPSAPRRWRVAPVPPSGGLGLQSVPQSRLPMLRIRIRFRARASSFPLAPVCLPPQSRLRPGHDVASGSGVEGAQPAERREYARSRSVIYDSLSSSSGLRMASFLVFRMVRSSMTPSFIRSSTQSCSCVFRTFSVLTSS
jgi:hypothetical protein